MPDTSLVRVACQGTPYEIGIQHGRTARTQVWGSISFYRKLFLHYSKLQWSSVLESAIGWKEVVQTKWPKYYDEILGIAHGAEVDILEVIALNIRTEIAFGCFSDGCTSVYWETSSNTFLAQNWDWMEEQKHNLIVLDIRGHDTPRIRMVTEAGIIGKIGLNELGVGVCLNAIKVSGLNSMGIPVHLGLRLVLESKSASGALRSLEEMGMASSAHILIADAGVGFGFEFTATTSRRLDLDSQKRLFHTNHLVAQHKGVEDGIWLTDSLPRLERIQALADRHSMTSAREPDRDDIARMLDDHEGFPLSICRYEEGPLGMDATLFSIIMDLRRRQATVRIGRPCQPEEVLQLSFP